MRIKKSFWAFLGRESPEAPEVVAERVRKGMLLALGIHCGDQPHPLNVKVQIARGIYDLWYLRPDLMQAVSVSAGEVVACGVLTQITALFKDHHPLAGHHSIHAPSH